MLTPVTWLCQEAIKNVFIAFPPEQILFIYCAVTVLTKEGLYRMIFFFNFGASLVYVSKRLNLMSLPRKV